MFYFVPLNKNHVNAYAWQWSITVALCFADIPSTYAHVLLEVLEHRLFSERTPDGCHHVDRRSNYTLSHGSQCVSVCVCMCACVLGGLGGVGGGSAITLYYTTLLWRLFTLLANEMLFHLSVPEEYWEVWCVSEKKVSKVMWEQGCIFMQFNAICVLSYQPYFTYVKSTSSEWEKIVCFYRWWSCWPISQELQPKPEYIYFWQTKSVFEMFFGFETLPSVYSEREGGKNKTKNPVRVCHTAITDKVWCFGECRSCWKIRCVTEMMLYICCSTLIRQCEKMLMKTWCAIPVQFAYSHFLYLDPEGIMNNDWRESLSISIIICRSTLRLRVESSLWPRSKLWNHYDLFHLNDKTNYCAL